MTHGCLGLGTFLVQHRRTEVPQASGKGLMIRYLIYRSRTDLRPSDTSYQHILLRSRMRNADLGVTGYLHWEDGVFHQWIEGPAAELLTVEEIIMADTMHRDVTILHRGEVSVREFDGWSMAASVSEERSLFNFMARSAISTRDHAAYACSVLQFMKQQLPTGSAAGSHVQPGGRASSA